jgi:hypothetical protein
MAFSIQYPLVNGHRWSWASLEMTFNGLLYVGVKSLNYKPSLKPGLVRGTGSNPIGRTKGEAEYTGDFEMLRLEFDQLVATLGGAVRGYGEVAFPIVVTRFEVGSPVSIDIIDGVRIDEVDLSNAQGSDASTAKCTFTAMRMLLNGAGITSPAGFAL